MELKINDTPDRIFIEMHGDLDGNTSSKAAEDVVSACRSGCHLEIDMAGCRYVSSAGLRALLTIGKSVKSGGGRMKLLNMSDEIADIMAMTGFENIFKGLE